MTTSQFQALIIDESLGELSEEASALLAAWLAAFPEHQAEADRIRDAVGLTTQAVASRPLDLRPEAVVEFPKPASRLPALLRLAASVVLLCLAAGAGFFAGKESGDADPGRPAMADGMRSSEPSPWAQYRVGENGRLAVILPSDPNS